MDATHVGQVATINKFGYSREESSFPATAMLAGAGRLEKYLITKREALFPKGEKRTAVGNPSDPNNRYQRSPVKRNPRTISCFERESSLQ